MHSQHYLALRDAMNATRAASTAIRRAADSARESDEDVTDYCDALEALAESVNAAATALFQMDDEGDRLSEGLTASETFDAMSTDDRVLGFGYLGARRHAAPIQRAQVDEAILAHARVLGLDYEALFAWANSKDGRHYADLALGSRPDEARAYLPRG